MGLGALRVAGQALVGADRGWVDVGLSLRAGLEADLLGVRVRVRVRGRGRGRVRVGVRVGVRVEVEVKAGLEADHVARFGRPRDTHIECVGRGTRGTIGGATARARRTALVAGRAR